MSIYGETFLEDDYDLIKRRIEQLENVTETKNQEIHIIKSKILLGTALEFDYLNEIETLRLNGTQNESDLMKQIKQLEESLQSTDDKFYDCEQTDLIDELQKKKQELEELINIKTLDESNSSEAMNDSLIEESRQLECKLIKIQESYDLLLNQYEALQNTNKDLQIIISERNKELIYYNQQLCEIQKRTSLLQDECLVIKELVSIKDKPLNPSKQGNSLFAEVHDSEKKLRAAISKLERQHRDLNIKLCSRRKQIIALCEENLKQSFILDTIEDYDIINDQHVKELESEISNLQLEMKNQKFEIQKDFQLTGKDISKDMLYFAKETLKEKWTDIITDIELLNKSYLNKLEVGMKLTQSDTNLRKTKRNILQLKVQLEDMENILCDLQCQLKSDENVKNVNAEKENVNFNVENVKPNCVMWSKVELT